MKLKFDRMTVLSLLVMLSLSSCKKPATVPQASIPNPRIANLSASPSLDRFLFMRNGKFGYIDRTGKIVIPEKFDRVGGLTHGELTNFSEGLAAVGIGEKSGYIDPMGKIVIPLQFSEAESFHEGLAAVSIGKKWGYIDPTGKIVVPLKFGQADSFYEGLAAVSTDKDLINEWSYIDRTGKIVIPGLFNSPARFKNGLADVYVTNSNMCKTIDRTGKVVANSCIPVKAPQGKSDDLISFSENKKYGYKERTGKIVIPAQFNGGASGFSDGLAWVIIGQKLGYIDKNGNVVVPARYKYPSNNTKTDVPDEIVTMGNPLGGFSASSNFDRGLAIVVIPTKCKGTSDKNCDRVGYIDTTGKLVFEF
jgi:WG containing repeat